MENGVAMTSSTILRSARKSSGLSQVDLSDITDVDQASISRVETGRDVTLSTLDRLLGATGHRLYALPSVRADAAALAAEIRGWLRRGDTDRAVRALIQLSDNLRAERGLLRGVLAVAEPELIGLPVWDAVVAGLVEWRLEEEGLPFPAWTGKPERILQRTRAFIVDTADPLPPSEATPEPFRRRGVLVWPDMFESV